MTVVLLLALLLAIYYPVFGKRKKPFSKFMFSDQSVFRAIPAYLQAREQSGSLLSPYRTRSGWLWDMMRHRRRTIPYLTLMWTYQHFGERSNVYHVTDLTIHYVNVLLVYGIFSPFLPEFQATMIVLIFAVHPLAIYTPCFVSARFGLLCAFFMLSSVYLLINGMVAPSIVAGVLAFNSKEESILLPIYWGIVLWLQ